MFWGPVESLPSIKMGFRVLSNVAVSGVTVATIWSKMLLLFSVLFLASARMDSAVAVNTGGLCGGFRNCSGAMLLVVRRRRYDGRRAKPCNRTWLARELRRRRARWEARVAARRSTRRERRRRRGFMVRGRSSSMASFGQVLRTTLPEVLSQIGPLRLQDFGSVM